MHLFARFRRNIATVSLVSLLAQIIFPALTYAANPILSATLSQANIVAGAQIVTMNVPRDLVVGDSLVFTMSGTTIVQTFDTSSIVTLGLLNVKIDALPEVSSIVDTVARNYTISSALPGVAFSSPTLIIQAAAQNFNTLVNNVVAVAQEAEFLVQANIVPGDTIGVTVAGTGVIQNYTTNKATTLTTLASQITNNTSVNASYSGSTGKIHLIAKVPGSPFSLSNVSIQSTGVASIILQPNVVPVAQVSSISLPRTIDSGEILTLNVAGSPVTQSFTGSSLNTLNLFTNQIDALSAVNASILGNTLTITAAIPGTPFTLGNLNVTGGRGVLIQTHPNIIAVAQQDVLSFGRDFFAGDTLTGSINGSPIIRSFSGSSSTTLAGLAGQIDALPLVAATSNSALKTITITSTAPGIPFTTGVFSIQTQIPDVLAIPNTAPVSQTETLTFPRNLVVGDQVSLVINGSTITQNFATNSNATLTAFASALSSGGVSATVSLPTRTITLSAVTPGVAFTVSGLSVLNQLSPTILQNPTNPVKQVMVYSIPQTLISGDIITGTIAGQSFTGAYAGSDATTLTNLASQIDAFTSVDAVADTSARTITVTASTGGVPFTASSLITTSSPTNSSQIATNISEVRANIAINLLQVPVSGDSVVLGGCLIQFETGASDYNCSDSVAHVSIDSASTNTIAALLRGINGVTDPVNGILSATGSSATAGFVRSTSQVGTAGIQFIDATTAGTLSTTTTPAQIAGAQSERYTAPRTLVNGDTLSLQLDGTTFSQTFLGSSSTTLANLASNINNLPYLNATASGQTIIVTATTPGNAFVGGTLSLQHDSLASQTISNFVGTKAVQSITFATGFVAGDRVAITVNGTPTSTLFSTDSSTTLNNIASTLSAVNGVTATASGTNTLIVSETATGANLVIGSTQVENTSPATVTQSNVIAVAQSDTFTLPYDLVVGRTIVAGLGGSPLSQAFSTDTNTTMTLLGGQFENI